MRRKSFAYGREKSLPLVYKEKKRDVHSNDRNQGRALVVQIAMTKKGETTWERRRKEPSTGTTQMVQPRPTEKL